MPANLPVEPEQLIRLFTIVSLCGLLFGVGLRLNWLEVSAALRACKLWRLLLANFIAVPLLVGGVSIALRLEVETAIGMSLLAAAPFAPVVPVFVKLARGDLALAAGLTAIMPVFSTFLTPPICHAGMVLLTGQDSYRAFEPLSILMVLFMSNTLPLLAGMAMRRAFPRFSTQLLRPLEIVAEGAGLAALLYAVAVQLPAILGMGWLALAVMVACSELSFALGYWAGGRRLASRRVIAFGTANRNIALAILISTQAFASTGVLASVVANGLLLILLGLLHVAYYRFIAKA